MKTTNKEPKLPADPARCADLYYSTRQQRLAKQREVEDLARLEHALEKRFVDTLSKNSPGVFGRIARIEVDSKVIPTVKDWNKFYDYVRRTKQFDLIQKRISTKAVEERWEGGQQVPGVERFNVKFVRCNALKQRRK